MFRGICWFCHWGWPEAICEIYERAEKDIEALGHDGEHCLEYGPTHCVWCDENFYGDYRYEREHCKIQETWDDTPPEVLPILLRSLDELEALPDELKQPPTEYDGENPEKYSPPPEWKCRQKKGMYETSEIAP